MICFTLQASDRTSLSFSSFFYITQCDVPHFDWLIDTCMNVFCFFSRETLQVKNATLLMEVCIQHLLQAMPFTFNSHGNSIA